MGLAVVVVVNDEGAKEEAVVIVVVVFGGRGGREGRRERERERVAVFLSGGDREEAEGFFVRVAEAEGFGDDGGRAAGEEAVGEPSGVERVGGVGGAAAIDVV